MKNESQLNQSPNSKYIPFLEPDSMTDRNGITKARDYYPTNNVMICPQKQTIYLPAFLKLKFKNFTDLNIGGLSALLNGQIIIVIYYGQLFDSFKQNKIKQIQNCLMNQIVLLFARDNAIKLTKNHQENEEKDIDIKSSHNIQKHQVKFVVKKIFNLYLDSDIVLTPFELINGILEITIKSVKIKFPYQFKDGKLKYREKPSEGNQFKNWKIQFNLQNNWNIQEKVSFKNWGTFGNYDLAEKKIGALYTNYRISQAKDFLMSVEQRIKNQQDKNKKEQNHHLHKMNSQGEIKSFCNIASQQQIRQSPYKQRQNPMNTSIYPLNQPQRPTINQFVPNQTEQLIAPVEQKQIKIQPFHYAYFNIPLYKFPFSAIITIFVPLFFLDILNFGILFQDKSLSDRIAAIATLVLAFAALVPTIRSQIPPSPKITLIQILVYLQTLPTILAIVQSLDVVDMFLINTNASFEYDWLNNGYFWVAFSISCITFLIILVLVILHYCKWYPEYNDIDDGSKKPVFDRIKWRNTECNKYFAKLFEQEKNDQLKAVILKVRK